ncbi:MAG: hypothetical protein ACI92X_001400 [Dokdonia sp.]|jgi:hypothetical protein
MFKIKTMKNSLIFLSLILLYACSSDDSTEPFTLENKTYKIVAFETETNMDLNRDGVFSIDLLSELPTQSSSLLSQMTMRFKADDTVSYPWYDWPDFNVIDGEQTSWTGALSSESISYNLNESNIRFDFGNTITSGQLSNDGITVVASYDPSILYGDVFNFVGNFINDTSEIETYAGDFILTLELQE